MTWAKAADVRYILIEATADTSYWNDDTKIDPYIVGAERWAISELAAYFDLEDLTDWQVEAQGNAPGVLIEISKHRAAAEILNACGQFGEMISPDMISRERVMAQEMVNKLKSGETVIVDKNGIEYRADVFGVNCPDYEGIEDKDDPYKFPVNPQSGDIRFRW